MFFYHFVRASIKMGFLRCFEWQRAERLNEAQSVTEEFLHGSHFALYKNYAPVGIPTEVIGSFTTDFLGNRQSPNGPVESLSLTYLHKNKE